MTTFLKNIGIGQRTLLIFAIPMLVVILALGYRITTGYMDDARNALDTRGALMARQLAALCELSLYAQDLDELRKQAESVVHEEDVAAVQVSNVTGRTLVQLGSAYTSGDSNIASFSAPVIRTGVNISDFESETIMADSGAGRVAVIGNVTVSLSMAGMRRKLENTLLSGSLLTISGLLASILLAYFVARSVSGPIRHLTSVVGKLTGGDLAARCRQGSPGELGSLETGINQMADSLQNAQNKLVREIEAATAALQHTVTELEAKNIELDHARDEAVRAAAAKADFLARMSHEIRTPLSAIIGFNELLGKTRLSENQQEYSRTINQAASQLLLVIEDILGYTRLGSGRLVLEQLPFNLHDCLENVVGMLSASAHEKRLELVLYIHSDVPRLIISDQSRLSQVLTNLAANAIKFTEQGHVIIEVSLHECAPDTVTVRVAVSDTGIGLGESQLGQIFDPFVQADISTSRKYGGTGLGLSISKKLVERLGGEIQVSSKPGMGSTFSFTLPSPRVEESSTLPAKILAGKTVLVYDSNPFSLRALRNRFFTWGATVFNTPDHDRLQQMLADREPGNGPFDLLVMGLSCGEFGQHSCNELCSTYATPIPVPRLFLVSAELDDPAPDSDCRTDCRILPKPVRSDLLLRTARSLLKISDKPAPALPTAISGVEADARTLRDGLNVLVVEDNRFNQDLFSRILGNLGVQTTLAGNGKEACTLAGSQRYDIIFMDIHMPVMGGIEATHNIRQGINSQTPVIALTADVFTNRQNDLAREGLDDCLYKPVSEQRLVDMLHRWGLRRTPAADPASDGIGLTPELHQRLRRELENRLRELRQAYADCDEPAVQDHLHQLKGIVEYFELDEVGASFKTLHAAILSRHASTVESAIDRLESLLAQQAPD
jgi:two-component system sensor histidine kinase BarA